MTPPDGQPDAADAAGERAARNTVYRAGGEIAGKLASLAAFALLARREGASGLGTYVLALAWGEVAMTPVGLGIDRYMLRLLAADLLRLDGLYYNALVLKLARGVPICVLAIVAAFAAGYRGEAALVIAIMTVAVLLETLARTQMDVFNAFERAGLVAVAIVAQRLVAAGLAIVALLVGYGTTAVALAFCVGCLLRLTLSHVLLVRRIRRPAAVLPPGPRRDLRRRSLPYIAQDLFGLVVARADILLLSALATSAVVGAYGAAYRLLDATAFISLSLQGAYTAMYTYLGRETVPTLGAVFRRSIKAAVALLIPVAVAFAGLAEPIVEAFFGPKLAAAAEPLRVLAPVVVLFALYVLGAALVVSRRDAWELLRIMIAAAIVNVLLNLALIPSWGATGAAAAMLGSSAVFAALSLRVSLHETGRIGLVSLIAAPVVAGVAMAVPLFVLRPALVPALLAGSLVYVLVAALVERIVDPADFRFAAGLVRRVLPSRRRGGPLARSAP
jgi:O-antigen/teichoic acid export membrane protein